MLFSLTTFLVSILDVFKCMTLVKIYPEFRRNTAGIPARTSPDFSGIPGEFQVESARIHRNYCRHSTGIPLELLPAFHQNSGLKFRRNYCRYSSGISTGIPCFCVAFVQRLNIIIITEFLGKVRTLFKCQFV